MAQPKRTNGGGYAELHCLSNFSFLRGASHPVELVTTAVELGYAGLALTDECSMAGVVRAHGAAKKLSFNLMIGSEITFVDGLKVVALAVDREAYAALCRLITAGRRAAPKGTYELNRDDLARCLQSSGCLLLWLPHQADESALLATGAWLKERFAERIWIAAELLNDGNDRRRLAELRGAGKSLGLRLVASGNVHMHRRERRKLQDTLTAIRLQAPIDKLGFELQPNAERCLRPLSELERRYPQELLAETLAILERGAFSLDELRYEYPRELVPSGETPASHLRKLTEQGARWRWPEGAPPNACALIEHELALIADLRYEAYFLTVHDIVRYARGVGILCQGRGSAANSVVCFCLGITEVDPARMQMLVERFISKERNEPPDIDVDFEHERREEVIQYIYRKYSRERAAIAATVITYRPKSAIRDVGKALGLDEPQVTALARSLQWWDGSGIVAERIAAAGFDAGNPLIQNWLELTETLIGFPRHLSQHVGGFVIAERPLDELVPVENATMPERTVIQWDKDDLEELGLLKVDVLGLGMLSAIRRSFDLIERWDGRKLTIATTPPEDPEVYEMISRADTMGVFQIESRAQMAMLPRLKPKKYFDLVIEVALVRPGPIQGDMVHPYLRRRNGEEPVTYPSEDVRKVLERTLGVPIFQEQVMQLAIVAAGFTAGEADALRRAMAAWRRSGELERFEQRLIVGMTQRNYSREFAERIFSQIKGFGEYGFPLSHAASFALLVYVSAWLKHYEPAVFCCALLNSQPMGFYAPQQLVRSACEHGVEVRPADINRSEWESTLERRDDGRPALRLGLHRVKGLSAEGGKRVAQMRTERPFADVADLAARSGLGGRDLGALAAAGALKSLASNRHQARWDVAGVDEPTELFGRMRFNEAVPMLRRPTEGEDITADYRHLGLSLGRHPLALLRRRLDALHVLDARSVAALPHGARVRSAGVVITRQRPSSASGVTFVTLEDETGYLNLVVWESLAQSARSALLGAALLGVVGKVQKEGAVLHVIAERLYDHSELLGDLVTRSRDFH
ncbi:MAG TPA: error-prone DNA polymerase [Gammaproteobacteria bacterium]|nr:error-prone DNA polymerase [Gammaproteobacteria bacterium]